MNPVQAEPRPITNRAEHLAYLASIGGYFQLPNLAIDRWMLELSDPQFKIYMLMLRQTLGFNRDVWRAGTARIAKLTGLGESTVKRALPILADLGIVTPLGSGEYGSQEGMAYRVHIEPGSERTPSAMAHMKLHDDHDSMTDHHPAAPVEIYQQLTGNRWKKNDDDAFRKLIEEVSLEPAEIYAWMREIRADAPSGINGFAYFAKSIRQRIEAKGRGLTETYKTIMAEMRGAYVGASAGEVEEAFRRRCEARGIVFDKKLYNDLA